MPGSSNGRSSCGRSWPSRVSCPGRCARHRPGFGTLLRSEPSPGPRTPSSGLSTISGPKTVSPLAVTCGWRLGCHAQRQKEVLCKCVFGASQQRAASGSGCPFPRALPASQLGSWACPNALLPGAQNPLEAESPSLPPLCCRALFVEGEGLEGALQATLGSPLSLPPQTPWTGPWLARTPFSWSRPRRRE